MPCLICGSIAFDYILPFDGRFRDHILPEQMHILNVSFIAPTMHQEFGGCAGNITYSLQLLGEKPLIMGTVGHDSAPYFKHFDTLGIDYQHIRVLPDLFTAQTIIATDQENNQISIFHPGASAHAYLNKVQDAKNIDLCIIAPNNKRAMLEHATACAAINIPFIFDPGQMLPMFTQEELVELLDLSSYLTLNDYEAQLLIKITKLDLEEIAKRVEAVIVTQGEHGATIMEHGRTYLIPAIKPKQVIDPTGCGDAFRAGLIFGITHQLDWLTIGRLSNLLGSIKVESLGPQNHQFSLETITEYFNQNFGYYFNI